MNLINNLIIAIDEAGLRLDAYSTIHSISFYLAIFLGILHGFKLKVGVIAVIVSVLVERYLAGPLATAIIYVENGFVDTGKQNAVVAFVFVPLFGFVLAKIFRKSYNKPTTRDTVVVTDEGEYPIWDKDFEKLYSSSLGK